MENKIINLEDYRRPKEYSNTVEINSNCYDELKNSYIKLLREKYLIKRDS